MCRAMAIAAIAYQTSCRHQHLAVDAFARNDRIVFGGGMFGVPEAFRAWMPILVRAEQAGAEIHVYQPTMMHVKMMIVDNFMVSVGSTNFDERSFHLNDEASLNIYDRDFALAMTEVFERDMRECEIYDHKKWSERPWTEKFMETVIIPLRSQL